MRIILALLLFVSTALAQRPQRQVYILAGQSNMAGRGQVTEADRQIHPRVFTLDANDRWRHATAPLHFDKKIAGLGPGSSFGRLIADSDSSIEVGLVPCAVGGSSITAWLPGAAHPGTGSHPLDDLLRRIEVAKQWGTIHGVIWHQGESDIKREPDEYRAALLGLITRVRAKAGDPQLPWVVATLGDFQTRGSKAAQRMNSLLAALPSETEQLACVRSAGLSDKGDGVHFDAQSNRALGRRYALAFLDLKRGLAAAPGKASARPLWPHTPPIGPRFEFEEGTASEDGHLRRIRTPTITVHLPAEETRNGSAVLVCPGGGYSVVAAGHEGTAVAAWLNSLGITAVVLRYRLKEYGHPAPMLDAQRAMRWLRSRSGVYGIDPARIGVLGFSAGGHLAATVTTHFDEGDETAADLVARRSCRPDFAILVYPVITMSDAATHRGSRRNLLGKEPSAFWSAYYSNELQVSARTAPTFLVHSRDDKAVPLANSELFRDALRKRGVPVELAIYDQGGHGYGLGRKGLDCAAWPKRCAQWLKQR